MVSSDNDQWTIEKIRLPLGIRLGIPLRFVPARPARRTDATIDPGGLVTLHYDTDQSIGIAAIQDVLDRPKSVVWSDATVHSEQPFDRIWLHLSVADNGTVRIEAD